jgi:hypothetical protein
VGTEAGYSATGYKNCFVGYQAGDEMTSGNNNTILGSYNGNQGGLDIRTSNNYIVLSDGDGNPRAVVDAGGNLLVGKTATSANNTGVQLEAAGVGVFTIDGDAAGIFNRKTSNGQVVQFRKDNTTVGSVSVTGSSTAYNTSSDYRLKENVADLTGAADRVQQLAPKRFNFIADVDTTVDGFLAHEVQDIVPEAITGAKDAVDADGNPEYQGIDQSKLVPLLTAALQEALTKIDALETRIVALESN